MPTVDFKNFAVLFDPVAWVFIWLPIAGFIVGACRAWKRDRKLFRQTYSLLERWRLIAPSIAMTDMVLIAARCHATHGDLPAHFWYLFWSMLPVTIYFAYHYRRCRAFAMWICLAQIWLAPFIALLAIAPYISD